MAVNHIRVKLAEGGRIVLPAPFRQALGLRTGDEVLVRLEDGEVRLLTIEQTLRSAQEEVRKYIPPGVSLVDELIAERRAESECE